jgi:large subunit ribosomal protein L19
MSKIKMAEAKYMKKELPKFSVGDTVKVYTKIIEEGKQRLQAFEGMVIGKKGSGIKESFTVRRISYGEGVERIFPIHAPTIDRVEVVRRGKVKRAKLYYVRKRVGKKTVVEEKIGPGPEKEKPAAE